MVSVGSGERFVRTVSLAVALTACGAPAPPAPTGGVDVSMTTCGRGLVVVGTDYQSTNVSLADIEGRVLSASFLSSGTAQASLSAPLSGDVVAPPVPLLGEELLLIDRFPTAVLTWVDVGTAKVRAQLNVSTQFASNPHDYLKLSETRAYLSRFNKNASAGSAAFDEGADVLLIDPSQPSITGRIDLSEAMADAPGFEASPSRMLLRGGRVYLILQAHKADYSDSASSRVVTIDIERDEVVSVTVLNGLHNCAGLAPLSPHSEPTVELAVSCSGKFGGNSAPGLEHSGLVLLAGETVLAETQRWTAAQLLGQPLGMSLDVAFGPTGQRQVLVTALGRFASAGQAAQTDALVAVDVQAGTSQTVWRSELAPFELGDVRCLNEVGNELGSQSDACGACFLADAEAQQIHRFRATEQGVVFEGSEVVEQQIGLPPRGLGRY